MAPTTVRSSRDDAEEHSSENSLPASPPLQTSDLDPISAETRRKDLLTGIFMAAVAAVFEMGPAIAKKGYGASDFEVALITSGHSLGLLLTFMTAYLAARFGNIRLVFWPELAARVCLALLFFVRPGFALAFVVLHAAAQMFQAMTIPARVTIYRTNYPSELRGRIVGRNRQIQMFVVTITAVIISTFLEWTVGNQRVVVPKVCRLAAARRCTMSQLARCLQSLAMTPTNSMCWLRWSQPENIVRRQSRPCEKSRQRVGRKNNSPRWLTICLATSVRCPRAIARADQPQTQSLWQKVWRANCPQLKAKPSKIVC